MKLIGLLAVFVISAFGFSQAPDFGGVAQKEAMKKLSMIVGEWKGTGWAEAGDQKREFEGNELILLKCDGTLLSLEGNHFMNIQGRKIPVHIAFGMLRYDDRAKTYKMLAHLANGLEQEYPMTVTSDGYIWSQKHPTWGEVTYTAHFTKDSWIEYGEVVKDGAKRRIYEMKLSRVK